MRQSLTSDESGTAMVEMAIVASLLFIVVLGFVDFGYAFYQWNAANKAVQVGARLASISNPVADGLQNLVDATNLATTSNVAGDDVGPGVYKVVCDGATQSCSCTGTSCVNISFDQTAFNLIYDGDSSRPGMHDFFPRLEKKNIQIEYVATGLGYWTRPDGPVPTIKVSLQSLTFQFYFLGGLLGFNDINIPSMVSSVTGEDLDSSSP